MKEVELFRPFYGYVFMCEGTLRFNLGIGIW